VIARKHRREEETKEREIVMSRRGREKAGAIIIYISHRKKMGVKNDNLLGENCAERGGERSLGKLWPGEAAGEEKREVEGVFKQ